jgi:hypothetical protein
MKKYTFFISILILSIILAFPGCGGGKKSSGGNGGIKIYESMGGVAYMPKNLSGIAFADSITEIGNEYIYFVGNNSESVVPTITAYCKDGEGNIIDVPVVFAVEGDSCFNMEYPQNLTGGGSAFQLVGVAPGGKAKLTATANGQTREIDVYIYDSYGQLGLTGGIRINNDGSKDMSNISNGDCAFYLAVPGVTIIGKSYLVDTCDGFTWKEKLSSIKTVDTAQLAASNVNNLLETNKIFIAEVPFTGGYMKIVRIGVSEIWEYSPTTSFK